MAEKKIIAVAGAPGAQGGGLVRAIMADQGGPFTARALTRNPNSGKAKALAALGAEIVHADEDDAASPARSIPNCRRSSSGLPRTRARSRSSSLR